MAGRRHLIAVNRTVSAAGLDAVASAAAAVELARNLARRMDRAGADEAPMSLVTAFQAAVVRLQRLEAREAAAKAGRNTPEQAAPGTGELDELEAFKRRWRLHSAQGQRIAND